MSADRQRNRRRRRTSSAQRQPPRSTGPRTWRQRLDSYGGLTMVGVVVAIVAFLAIVLWQNRPVSVSDAPQLGEARTYTGATHVADPALLQIREGEPPAGGPHFAVPLRPDVFDEPVADGNAIHSLEHGMVWISYNPELVTPEQIEVLENIANDHGNDVLLSPRPANSMAVAAVSWERLLSLDGVDRERLEEFIEVNTNRSPEPGLR